MLTVFYLTVICTIILRGSRYSHPRHSRADCQNVKLTVTPVRLTVRSTHSARQLGPALKDTGWRTVGARRLFEKAVAKEWGLSSGRISEHSTQVNPPLEVRENIYTKSCL